MSRQARLNMILMIFAAYLLADLYTYFGLKTLVGKRFKTPFTILYWSVSTFIAYCFYQTYIAMEAGTIFRDADYGIYFGLFLTAMVTKFVFAGAMLLQDVGLLLGGLFNFLFKKKKPALPSRRRFLTTAAAGVAAAPFFTMLYGITKGKYNFKINKVPLSFADLPKAFNGFKVLQISDMHAGSLDSPSAIERMVDMINGQSPDLVLFTGDLVNSDKDEVDPFIDIMKKIEAPFGKFSVLGNHDYYGAPRGNDLQATNEYWSDFKNKYQQMGFQLLNNENVAIQKAGSSIRLLGVENWGHARYFPKKGNLDQALQNTSQEDFCILMSHDPSHWDHKVLPHERHVHLTLSGHTHGAQFGVNIPGFKWSPIQYRYSRWMGLYEEQNQYLYVNRGFGYLAFPGRVGMWPELTVFEFSSMT
ncbi:MAG: metallophosphoesterase [Saprospiraceae bacterium]